MDNLNLIFNFIENNPILFFILFFTFITTLIIFNIAVKGFALWKAARLTDKNWFIFMLIINTAGILELYYIFVVAKKKERQNNPQTTETKSNL